MAWFTVQYRDKSGAKAEAEFEAADRAALFEILAGRDISAVSVREGRSAHVKKEKAISLHHVLVAFSLVLIAVLCVALALYLFKMTDDVLPSIEKDRGYKKTSFKKVVSQPTNATANIISEPGDFVQSGGNRLGDDAETIARVQREGGYYTDSEGKKHRVKVHKTVFSTSTDAILCAVVSAGRHELMLPPFDGTEDEEFRKSLRIPIIITPDDSDEIKEKKLLVRAARKEVKELMDEGHSFRSVVLGHIDDMALS